MVKIFFAQAMGV